MLKNRALRDVSEGKFVVKSGERHHNPNRDGRVG